MLVTLDYLRVELKLNITYCYKYTTSSIEYLSYAAMAIVTNQTFLSCTVVTLLLTITRFILAK